MPGEGASANGGAMLVRLENCERRASRLDGQVNGDEARDGLMTRVALIESRLDTILVEVRHLRYSAYSIVVAVVGAAVAIIVFGGGAP